MVVNEVSERLKHPNKHEVYEVILSITITFGFLITVDKTDLFLKLLATRVKLKDSCNCSLIRSSQPRVEQLGSEMVIKSPDLR